MKIWFLFLCWAYFYWILIYLSNSIYLRRHIKIGIHICRSCGCSPQTSQRKSCIESTFWIMSLSGIWRKLCLLEDSHCDLWSPCNRFPHATLLYTSRSNLHLLAAEINNIGLEICYYCENHKFRYSIYV